MGFTQILRIHSHLPLPSTVHISTRSLKTQFKYKSSIKCCSSPVNNRSSRNDFFEKRNENLNSSGGSWLRKPSLLHSAPFLAALAWVCRERMIAQSQGRMREIATRFAKRKMSWMEQDWGDLAFLSVTTSVAKQRISPILETLGSNRTFVSGFLAWASAQILKVFTTFVVERRWDLKMLVSSGGMPSSHAALCVGLTTSVALCHGVRDALFPVCLGFSLIVMYDAAGVRRHAGLQAAVLNMIVGDLFKGHPVSERKLKEILGHTPLQVIAGAFLGMFVGYLCSNGGTSIPC